MKNGEKTSSDLSGLFHYGCVAEIIHCDTTLPHQFTFKVKGICPSRIRDISNADGGCLFEALLEHHYLDTQSPQQQQTQQFHSLCHTYLKTLRSIGVSNHVLLQLERILTSYPVPHVANLLLYLMDASPVDKLRVLELLDLKQRLCQVNQVVTRHIQVKFMHSKIRNFHTYYMHFFNNRPSLQNLYNVTVT
jgi:Lon protease-like protein